MNDQVGPVGLLTFVLKLRLSLHKWRANDEITEQAGEVGSASTRVVLSKDDLKVDVVTELGDGLVEGFNNRAYIRVMTPDGRPVPLADVRVTNPWDELAPARDAPADEDGVAALQLDPGAPVVPQASGVTGGSTREAASSAALSSRRKGRAWWEATWNRRTPPARAPPAVAAGCPKP